MTDRAANNRKIAEWLEPKPTIHPRGAGRVKTGWIFSDEIDLTEERMVGWQPRDFYRDETASAAILEKLAKVCHDEDHYFSLVWTGNLWVAAQMRDYHDGNADMPVSALTVYVEDRKTAIAEACLRLIEREQR